MAIPACAGVVSVAGGRSVPIFRTHPLDRPDSTLWRALIIIHGASRDADRYFETGVAAARNTALLATTLVVAPRFRTSDDLPEAGAPYWTAGGWKRGHLSTPESGSPRVSSYAVLDQLLAELVTSGRFEGLNLIVVAGHSAGGQVTHRFAASSGFERSGVEIRYVVANPSTYLYLGPERWNGVDFTTPDVDACPDYARWHYGLGDRNSYASQSTADELGRRLGERDVRVLLGTADTLTASLDQSCGADLQGRRRLDRGRTLIRYMDQFQPTHHHQEVLIEGAGHSSRSIFLSPLGLDALFGS